MTTPFFCAAVAAVAADSVAVPEPVPVPPVPLPSPVPPVPLPSPYPGTVKPFVPDPPVPVPEPVPGRAALRLARRRRGVLRGQAECRAARGAEDRERRDAGADHQAEPTGLAVLPGGVRPATGVRPAAGVVRGGGCPGPVLLAVRTGGVAERRPAEERRGADEVRAASVLRVGVGARAVGAVQVGAAAVERVRRAERGAVGVRRLPLGPRCLLRVVLVVGRCGVRGLVHRCSPVVLGALVERRGTQYRLRTHDGPMNEPGGCSGVPRGPPSRVRA